MIGSKVMATRLGGFCLVTKGGYISGKGLVEKEAMERDSFYESNCHMSVCLFTFRGNI